MTDRRVRTGTKRRLVQCFSHLFASRPQPIAVEYTWDGKETVSRSTLWLGVIEGNTTPESIGQGQRLELDEFIIPVNVRLLGFVYGEVAEAAVEDVVNDIAAGLAATHRLTRWPGLDDGDVQSYLGIADVQVGPMDGPGHTFPGGPGQTIQGWGSFDLLCQSHLDFD